MNVKEEMVEKLKLNYITDIINTDNQKAVNVLVAYSGYLNSLPYKVDYYPLFLQILGTNNKYAIDTFLKESEPETYFDFVLPNEFILRSTFEIFSEHKRDEIYEMTLRILCGVLIKVYHSPEEGLQIYQPTISDINNLGKFLNESKDQDDSLNRDILDILMYITDLHDSKEPGISELVRQAGHLRSDFFDSNRGLKQSLPPSLLEESGGGYFGAAPEYLYK